MASASQAPQPPSDLAFVTTILGRLAILGALGLALYLGITSLMNGSIAGCTEGGGCHEVVASKWGYFLGIPVSLLGAGTYIVLLASDWSGCCPRVHALCRWMILLAVGWFVAVQAFILKEYCPWCCITHLLAVIGVACIWKKGTVPPSQVKILPLVGLAGVVMLALVQAFGPERETTAGRALAAGQETSVSEASSAGPRIVSLHGGKFEIAVEDFPSIGNAKTAKNVAVGLFDFTCPHCQHLHEILSDIQSEFGDQLAVVQLPGYFAPKGKAIQEQMLAVWKEDKDAYTQLATMLHEGTLKAVEQEVKTAIGATLDPDKHSDWLRAHDAWTKKVLAMGQDIRQANKKVLKTGKFPQLMIGDYVEAGSKPNKGHYYDLLKEKFGLTRTNAPKLAVTPTSVDFGQVYLGATQSFELEITNPGGPAVTLSPPKLLPGMRAKPGFAKTLESGAKTTMIIDAVPRGAGIMEGDIQILSDAEPGSTKVHVKAEVSAPYKAEPKTIDLGLYKGQPLKGHTTITFESQVKLSPPRANNSREFKVGIRELEPGLRYEVHVVATPNSTRAGFHQTSITLDMQPVETIMAWPKSLRLNARCRVAATNAKPPGEKKPLPIPLRSN
ncbi:hypothetical protein N8586_01275 [Verrucomicrobiales bacterium]|nr:hypothetical protein [Verrucomicrobiales bacterium]